jgi:hypothetical protein
LDSATVGSTSMPLVGVPPTEVVMVKLAVPVCEPLLVFVMS